MSGRHEKPRRRAWRYFVIGAGFLVCGAIVAGGAGSALMREVRSRMGRHTVESRLAAFGPRHEPAWRDRCHAASIVYPPATVVLVGLKRERELRIYAETEGRYALLTSYPFTAGSGTTGPKLREGDRQVPEGIYAIESLNPNSRYHLALRVGYPNDEDRRVAAIEGRTNLGSDIMIHGSDGSVGCIAIGDRAIEEVFVLAAVVGTAQVQAVLSPSADPLADVTEHTPKWVADRYKVLSERLAALGFNAR